MLIERGTIGKSKILVVDDECQVLNSLADLFRKEFHVVATDNVDKAFRLLETRTFALVISDQRMATVSGTEVLADATRICPDTFRILLTAYSDIQAAIDSVNKGHVYAYLSKPWDGAQLLELARKLSHKYAMIEDYRSLVLKLGQMNAGEFPNSADSNAVDAPQIYDSERDNQVLEQSLKNLTQSFDELMRIRQMVPICCRCKKIKTSSAGWEELGQYLERNHLFLTHGFCPECYEKALEDSKRQQSNS